jgi:hemolysin activation/secretion protein
VQSNWFMGGASTVRGYPVGAMSGNAFWRARGELATRLPIARLAVFSDMAWAGSREDFASSRPLMSVGAGVSFMDGIVRFDVAHALRDSRDWRVYLYMGGII